jgi:IclR family transcriptional regulator, acetate operon repressor
VAQETGPTYPIESVDRALTLLLAFETTDSMSITEAGKLLGVSRSTAYRLLSLLAYRGFVRQDERTKAFTGGPALLRVGLAAVNRSDLRTSLRPLLELVVARTDETAHLVVLQQRDAFFLDCVEGSKMIRATPRVGTSLPAHVTAAGKVLLAGLPEARLEDILSSSLPAVTRRSTVSSDSLIRELAQVRKQGWALNDGESEVGLRAVAVPIDAALTGDGIESAITVAGPSERFDDKQVEEFVDVLFACRRQFAEDLGFPAEVA